jgi:NAD dependent epimerase/dehydratase family enzyme
MSWIHEVGMNRLFEGALTDDTMQGIYIASSPHPASQVNFMRELRRAVGMPIGLPAFSWMAQFGAKFPLRTDPELALYGRYVVSKRLEDSGFEFQLPHLCEAFQAALSSTPPVPTA